MLHIGFFLWGIAVVFVNHLASKFASKRALLIQDKPLPDILHDVFPKIHYHLPDYLLLLCFLYTYFKFQIHDIDIVRLLCSLSLRPIFICLTTFPASDEEERSNPSLYDKIFLSKHDLMFSGHTCCFQFFGSVIGGSMGFSVSWLFPFSLIAARQHYTIDVVVAKLLYHQLLYII